PAKVVPYSRTQVRSANLGDFHGVLPAFQTVDVSRADLSWTQAPGDTAFVVVGRIRFRLTSQRRLKQSLYSGVIQPVWIDSQRLTYRQRGLSIHSDIQEGMHVWVSAEIEDGGRPFQPKNLALRNVAVLAMLVIAKEQCVQTAICLETLLRIADIVWCIR